jgi:hypothetical protein
MANVSTLNNLEFESTTQLVRFLNGAGFVWKADEETQKLYILDKSNPERHRSREYEIQDSKDYKGYVVLKEI